MQDMTPSAIQLKVGRKYQNRLGEIIKIITKIGPFEHGLSYRGDDTMIYRHDGHFLPDGSPTNYDLVKEVLP